MKYIGRFLEFISSRKYFSLLWTLLFFLIFGVAFYFIYLDAIVVKDQINIDFNKQQLILARQAASQINLFLDNLNIQMNYLDRFCRNKDSAIRDEAIKVVFDQNKEMGLIDIGFYNNDFIHENYFSHEEIPFEVDKLPKAVTLRSDVNIKLGDYIVYRNQSGKVFIISSIVLLIKNNGVPVGKIIARFDLAGMFARVVGNVRSGKTGYAWVIDDMANAIYHPEKEFIGKNIFEARKEKKAYVSFNQINEIMKKRMLTGQEGMEIYESWWHREIQGKVTKLIAFTPIMNPSLPGKSNWSIAVVAPTSEISQEVEKTYLRHYIAEGLIILGMFLFGILMIAYQRKVSASLKERVTEQEEYITSILENSMDAIIFTDQDNHIKVWNKGAEKIFGYTAGEMMGKSFHIIVPPEKDAEEELSQINELVHKHGYITNFIAQRITKSGKRVNVNISKTLISSTKGENLGYSIILRDETEKMEMEQRIYNTEKLASIGTLAAGIAHEINNPLAVILGYSDLLIEKFDKDSTIYADLRTIESNANNAKKIVENLLGFARITEGLDDNIDIRRGIETVVNIVKNTLFTQKIDVSMSIEEDLPHVKGDVREFEQVIFNLINNAVASMKNKGTGKINVSAYLLDDKVVVELTDTGEGIPNRIKQRIFDPFFTTKKVGEGTGIGLSLCYGIIAKFGGRMEFRSSSYEDNPNQQSGTTFTVELPTNLSNSI
jgi:PAS domain S-box-containing protein